MKSKNYLKNDLVHLSLDKILNHDVLMYINKNSKNYYRVEFSIIKTNMT